LDGGSIPPRSTKLSTDESQSNQATGTGNSGCGFFASETQLVSDSPKWAQKWQNFDNFLPLSENNIGTRECYSYRKKIFERHPHLENALKNHYLEIFHDKSLREANLFIGRIDKELIIHDLNLSNSEAEIKTFCENMSFRCRSTVIKYGENKTAYQICQGIAKKYSIDIDTFDSELPFIPTLNKLSCPKWWLKKINTLRKRHVEQVHRKLNLVHKHSACYASNFASAVRNTQLKNSYDYLNSNQITNEHGQSYTLLDIYNKSVSNPRIRKAELMTRIRGFEEVATEMGHAGEFYTLTSPSKMHAVLSSGKPNPKFDGSTPKEVNEYFNNNWKLIRSALQKKDIHPYGFRVVEPHHDATPHWHLLLFMLPQDTHKARKVFSKYALKEDGNERGAKQHRFKAISIDPKKGSAAGYIAKYISKYIDGDDITSDNYGNDSKIAASKIDAWSSLWGIRQFQQIGGPSVTVWRELRRLKGNTEPEISKAYNAADSGDWAAYVMAMGGAILPRRNRPIQPLYEEKPTEKIDINTGEISKSNLSYYGDIKPAFIVGLISKNTISRTRTMKWTKKMSPMTTYDPMFEGNNKELAGLLALDRRRGRSLSNEEEKSALGLV